MEIDERSVLASSMSNTAVGKAFNAIIKGTGINDIGEILFNWLKFLAWLLSEYPFDEKVYDVNIRNDTEWSALIRRAREVASGGIESRFMAITVAATQP